jgi:hypothetical protein
MVHSLECFDYILVLYEIAFIDSIKLYSIWKINIIESRTILITT